MNMLKFFIFYITLYFGTSINCFGQNIEELFRMMNIENCEDLTLTAKDSLLKYKIYEVPGGDSLENVQYKIDQIKEDYIKIFFYTMYTIFIYR